MYDGHDDAKLYDDHDGVRYKMHTFMMIIMPRCIFYDDHDDARCTNIYQ